MVEPDSPICRRCRRSIENLSPDTIDIYEGMHYVCFHYEFEHHDIDIDSECSVAGCPSRYDGLNHSLSEWTDCDYAAYALGRAIGLWDKSTVFESYKWVFWTDNPVGAGLHKVLLQLTEAGVLNCDSDLRFRWAGHDVPEASTDWLSDQQ